jgi:prophage regulatory protein
MLNRNSGKARTPFAKKPVSPKTPRIRGGLGSDPADRSRASAVIQAPDDPDENGRPSGCGVSVCGLPQSRKHSASERFAGSDGLALAGDSCFPGQRGMYALPETGYLRLRQIIGNPKAVPPIPALIPVGKSTWWAGVKSGRYPRPVRTLGARITAWRVEDIRDLIRRCSQTGECGAASDA